MSRRAPSWPPSRTSSSSSPTKATAGIDASAQADGSGDAAAVEVGAGELTIYDNLRRDDSVAWKDSVPRAAVPHTGYIPGLRTDPELRGVLARRSAARPSCSGSTAPPGPAGRSLRPTRPDSKKRPSATIASSASNSICFPFPDEIGSGLAVFHPKGGLLRKIMEDYSRQRHVEAGYEFVNTPHISKAELFDISGHLGFYGDLMYPPMHVDEERHADGSLKRQGQDYYLKPMNCPMHCLIFRSRGRSYRELPLRLFEFGSVYRYERSGVVHGLTRVRGMTQDDAHIFCTIDQMQAELISLLQFVLDLLADYGLTDFYLELSTRDPEKSIGSDEDWEWATEALRQAAEISGLDLVLDPGGRPSTLRRSRFRPATRSVVAGRCRRSRST